MLYAYLLKLQLKKFEKNKFVCLISNMNLSTQILSVQKVKAYRL